MDCSHPVSPEPNIYPALLRCRGRTRDARRAGEDSVPSTWGGGGGGADSTGFAGNILSAANATPARRRVTRRIGLRGSTVSGTRGNGRSTARGFGRASRQTPSGTAVVRGGGGSGRGRSRNIMRRLQQARSNWTIMPASATRVVSDVDFFKGFVDDRCGAYVKDVMHRVLRELDTSRVPDGRVQFFLLLLQAVLQQLLDWLNERIRQDNVDVQEVTFASLCRVLAVFLSSRLTGLSLEKTVANLSRTHIGIPSVTVVRAVVNNMTCCHPSLRRSGGNLAWMAQRDATQTMATFERLAFEPSKRLLSAPSCQFLTLDDDLFGTRAHDVPVKWLSSRKADAEGHTADVLSDAMFRFALDLRFRRRGETQIGSVRKLIDSAMEGHGQLSNRGAVVTCDRGYGRVVTMELLQSMSFNSLLILPDNLLFCHPFVARSRLKVGREDNLDDDDVVQNEAGLENDDLGDGDVMHERLEVEGNDEPAPMELHNEDDPFVIEDGENESMTYFKARRRISRRTGTRAVAVAVREDTRGRYAKVLRFLYDLTDDVSNKLDVWVATPNAQSVSRDLVDDSESAQSGDHTIRFLTRDAILDHCTPLTKGQRCADWFVLRRHRVTATVGAQILQKCDDCRILLDIPPVRSVPQTQEGWMDTLVNTWFSNRPGTEEMKRGLVNEDAVLSALDSMDEVAAVYCTGLLASKNNMEVACSPDGILLIRLPDEATAALHGSSKVVVCNGETYHVACLEIKTRVSDSSVSAITHRTCRTMQFELLSDPTLRDKVPTSHVFQMLQQCYVVGCNVAVYVCAVETGIVAMYAIVIDLPILETVIDALRGVIVPCVRWAHTSCEPPQFCTPEQRRILISKLPFWKTLNTQVCAEGVLPESVSAVWTAQHSTARCLEALRRGSHGRQKWYHRQSRL